MERSAQALAMMSERQVPNGRISLPHVYLRLLRIDDLWSILGDGLHIGSIDIL